MEAAVPKERVRKAPVDGYVDLLVQWGQDEVGPVDASNPYGRTVRLFPIATELGPQGGTMFHPNEPLPVAEGCEPMQPGSAVGPVDIRLDRDGINRLIRVLRRARDAAFGRDE